MVQTPRLGFRPTESSPIPPPIRRAREGAPNVVAIVLDDTGFAQLTPFGSDIATPAIDRLASEGLRYRAFHVTALCSPTRASFLTGRNHHAVGMGFLADIPLAYPGYTARIPRSAACLPRLLRDEGYSTLAVGKWHLTPRFERSAAGPFDHWPLGLGFERYYGFLQGDTNQWTPNLVCDNHYVDPPGAPEDGYHLSEDLVDTAIRYVLDSRQAAPGKPFFLYLAFGATHAPHHVPPSYVEPYRGRFDTGWEAWREETFARQLASGVVPEGTVLPPRPPWVPDWSELGVEERRMHARMQEVFAGFLSHTDAQIGRLLTFLEELGLLDDTILLLFSDNGASAEGGVSGSVNEHRFTARVSESVQDNLSALDDWGGFGTYNHYSWGWAWAGNTPLRLWKRYTWLGGTRTPLLVRYPAAISDPGAVRPQFVHAIDLMPTILDVCGIEVPEVVDGVTQQPVDGTSIRPTLVDPAAPDPRQTQYFEMLGSRSIYHEGWKAVTDHISYGVLDEEALVPGSRRFEDDRWLLFDLASDFSESRDLAEEHPARLRAMVERWSVEAGRNQVLPVDDGLIERMAAMIWPAYPAGGVQVFRPEGGPVHDESLPMLLAGFTATAEVEVPPARPDGVLFALGDRFGGFALFLDQGVLVFSCSRAGLVTEVVANQPVPTAVNRLSVTLRPEGDGETLTLCYDDEAVGSGVLDGPFPVAFQHGGALLRLGYDRPFSVSSRYRPPARFNGRLHRVTFEVPQRPASSGTAEVRAALHAD